MLNSKGTVAVYLRAGTDEQVTFVLSIHLYICVLVLMHYCVLIEKNNRITEVCCIVFAYLRNKSASIIEINNQRA